MRKIILEITAASLGRLALNTARRFLYPFAPALSRGLGVPLSSISMIIALNQASGLLALFIGPLTDRAGYKLMMMAALGVFAAAMLAGGWFPVYVLVAVALLAAGLAKNVFDPALQAYVGRRVPFSHRGLVIGILEISWAGSTLVGIPVIGLVIHHHGWPHAFLLIGAVAFLSMLGLGLLLPRDPQSARNRGSIRFLHAWKQVVTDPAAFATAGFAFAVSAANDNLFMVYGIWLEQSFGITLVAIGIGTSVIGAAELFGEGLTAVVSDRLGLKRSVLAGGLLVSLCYAVLPFFSATFPIALGGLFLVFVANEFTFVTTLALSTELLPDHRATMMSTLLASAGMGRVAGALCGGLIWPYGGIHGVGLVSAMISIIGFLMLGWGLRSWRKD